MIEAKVLVPEIRARKRSGPKIVAVTAYDATLARLLDAAGVDVLLVGDSLGMVVQGHASTLPVKLARNAGIRAGRATSFDTAAGRERGGITAANTVIVGPFAVEGAAIAVLERLSAPLLGMDMLNRFQIAYSGGFMILRGSR